MSAHYDSYDYPSYWNDRDYEHKAEVLALKAFLKKIPKIKSILEIGAGYGRLTPTYLFRSPKITLADPSGKLLKIAKGSIKAKRVIFIHSTIENLPIKIKGSSYDLIILVRVLHHINDVDGAFSIVRKLLSDNGYFILEFANKCHLKAIISEFLHGNFTFRHDIFPKEISGKKSKIKKISFKNYHPDTIRENLKKQGFKIIEERSVSNVRNPFIKKYIPKEFLLYFEKYFQKFLSKISFGPSIFILAKNT